MDVTQAETTQPDDISFMVVLNGEKCAPLLVQRGNFLSKVGSAAARKTYQTAYAPKDFPAATCVSSE